VPLDLLPSTFACAPISRLLRHRIGPFHGFARSSAPNRALFTIEEAERIVGAWKHLPAPADSEAPYEAHYNSIDKAFWFYDAGAEAWHKWDGEDVGLATLYPIGEGLWEWDCQD
jgi:hypothetical protein